MKAPTFALIALGVACAMFATVDAASPPASPSAVTLARGRALVVYGTCNDCHTAGWRDSDGAIPVTHWLTGSAVGFRGWWGTSYPSNVRLDVQSMTEDRWVQAVRTRAGHPPMVWQYLRQLPDRDLRAIYQFVKSLGPAGVPAPNAVQPWRDPSTSDASREVECCVGSGNRDYDGKDNEPDII
jgi:mono/diheme cytochrome c family protein